MSYLFIYRAPKHSRVKNGQTYYGQELMHTHYGVFDKMMLWRSLGRDYKVWGHGTHPIQEKLIKFKMIEQMVGHVVEIKCKKKAVWLKLNYDNVAKQSGTKFVGCYEDFDPAELDEYFKSLEEITAEFETVQRHRDFCQTRINYAKSSLDEISGANYYTKKHGGYPLFDQKTLTAISDHSSFWDAEHKEWSRQVENMRKKRERAAKKVTDYLASKKVS